KGFEKALALRREQSKLTTEVLDPTGAKLRNEIEQLQTWAVSKAGNSNTMILAGEAIKQLMLARLYANKLLGRHDDSPAQGADKAFADLKAAMAAFGSSIVNDEVRRVFSDVNANVDKYFDAYQRAVHDSHELTALVNGEMANMANHIAIDAGAIVESAV